MSDVPQKVRMCAATTIAHSMYCFNHQLFPYLKARGYEITGISSDGPELETMEEMGFRMHPIKMFRNPSPLRDLISFLRLWWFFLWHRFDVVFVSTPKAGFLGGLAARLTLHRNVIYMVRGRAYENIRGWKRWVISACERLACRCAKIVLPIARELGQTLLHEKLCPSEKLRYVGSGSSKGVDLEKFTRNPEVLEQAEQLRESLGLDSDALVVLYIGWLRKTKGIDELVESFLELAPGWPKLHLVLVGTVEPLDQPCVDVLEQIESHPRIHHIEWMVNPVPAYALGDIFAFASYREGFGNVALEAGAMELPVIGSDIMGIREAVLHGQTGILIPERDREALRAAIEELLRNPERRAILGAAARKRVEHEFRQEILFQGFADLCAEMLKSAGSGKK